MIVGLAGGLNGALAADGAGRAYGPAVTLGGLVSIALGLIIPHDPLDDGQKQALAEQWNQELRSAALTK